MKIETEDFMTWLKNYSNYAELKYRAERAFSGYNIMDPQVFFGNLREVVDLAEEVILLVEKFARDVDDLSGRDKLDAAVDAIDDMIHLNVFGEMVDGIAIKMILSTLVQQKNKYLGEDWIKDE